jgi:hypothetical protein
MAISLIAALCREGSNARRAPKRHDQDGQKRDCVSHFILNGRDHRVHMTDALFPKRTAIAICVQPFVRQQARLAIRSVLSA